MKMYRYSLLFVLIVAGVLFNGCSGTTPTQPTDPTSSPTSIVLTSIGPTSVGLTSIGPTSIGLTSIGPTSVSLTSIGPISIATPTPLPPPSGKDFSFVADYKEVDKYCVSLNRSLGAVVLSIPYSYNMTLISGPNVLIKKKPYANGLNNYYTYIGPAGAKFSLNECWIPLGGSPGTYQWNPALCAEFAESYGTCQQNPLNKDSCQPPSGGCPLRQHWDGTKCACLLN